jgi:gas vesicle protein
LEDKGKKMSENNNNDLGAFLAGFIIGSLVGAAAALILAPQSGRETRDQLVDKSSTFRDRAGQYGHEYREKAGSYLADARLRVTDASSQAQERINIVLDEGKNKLVKKNQVNDVTSQENETPEDAS